MYIPVVLGGFPGAHGVLACYCFFLNLVGLEHQDCILPLIRDVIVPAEKDKTEIDCRLHATSSTRGQRLAQSLQVFVPGRMRFVFALICPDLWH